jgi:hypothetical protein
VILYGNQGGYGNGPGSLGAIAISDRAGILCWGNAGGEGWSGGEARRVDDDFNLHRALWKHRWWIRGKGARTAGRVNWSVECSAMGEANERRKRAELRNICRAIAETLIEHRTSLIFCLNLASNGLIGACEARLCNPSTPDFFNRTGLEATANVYTFNHTSEVGPLSVQHSCPLAQTRPLAIFGVETTPARSPEKMQQPLC